MVHPFSSQLRQFALQAAMVTLLLPAIGVGISSAGASPVNVNSASQSELETIKGLGPAKARAIIAEREEGGSYHDAHDLQKRVRGIGMRSVEKLVDQGLTIETPSAYRETRGGPKAGSRLNGEANSRAGRHQARTRAPQNDPAPPKKYKYSKNGE